MAVPTLGVLAEDDVLEFLEHPVGLLEVVVLSDEAVAAAPVLADGLGVEEIEQLLATAPIHVADDGVGQVQLVARAPRHHVAAVGDELLEHLLERQRVRDVAVRVRAAHTTTALSVRATTLRTTALIRTAA